MPAEQDIRNQLEQLQLLRENVQFFRRQAHAHGGLPAAPVATQRGLASAYAEIARCKAVLRGWNVEVEDLPDDVSPADEPTPARAPAPRSITFDNHASNNGAQGEFYGPVNINHNHSAPAPPTPSTLTPRQRAELLDRLTLRYRELLDHALAHQVRLQLGLHTRPDAVDPAWRRMLLRGPLTAQPVPPGTPALELFDGQQGQMLVLGAPGAGKTTLIVELAQALTARALADAQARIPVVLNIAAWRSGQSLRDWLQRALRDVLGASRRFAAQLAGGDDLLLLLDGLDEVAADHRAACVAAISIYLGERDLAPPLVVGCRSREYADLGTRLPIAGAVELEPLELPAIERALEGVPAATGVLIALQTDELLRELASTPLIVNVLLLAHGGQGVPAVQTQTLEGRRQALWRAYVRRTLQQRSFALWLNKQTLYWLRWLACLLQTQKQTDFLIDDLQPTELSSIKLRLWYQGLSGLMAGIFSGLVGSFAILLVEVLGGPIGFGLLVGMTVIVLFGLSFGFSGTNNDLISRQITHRRDDWMCVWKHLKAKVFAGIGFGLGSGSFFGLLFDPGFGIGFGLCFGSLISISSTWNVEIIRRRERQKWSYLIFMRNLRRNLTVGFVFSLIGGSIFGLLFGLLIKPSLGVSFGLILGLGGASLWANWRASRWIIPF